MIAALLPTKAVDVARFAVGIAAALMRESKEPSLE